MLSTIARMMYPLARASSPAAASPARLGTPLASPFAARAASSAPAPDLRPLDDDEQLMGHAEHASGVIGREQLVRPTLWEQYSERVRQRMENPRYRGVIARADAEARGCELVVVDHGAEACGDAVRLHLAVQKGTGVVLDARFQTFGCATAIAASDAMAELCIGKTLKEAQKLVTSAAVERYLRDDPSKPAVPPQKMHCSVMASEVVKKAAAAGGAPGDAPASEDDEVVCDCAQVTLGAVRRAIREHGLRTVAEVTQATKAGAFCGACRKAGGHEAKPRYLVDVLREELARERVVAAVKEHVAPALGAHSGACEVLSVTFVEDTGAGDDGEQQQQQQQPDGADGAPLRAKEQQARRKRKMVVRIAFKGACSGCPHSGSATLAFVQDELRRRLAEPSLVVVSF